jgi:dihydrofolate synthase/folylpolyglutamate synthase
LPVLDRLDARPKCPVVTVTGTNGKGSVCAMLEAMLRAGGYRVGLYTSPHLVRYNERVCLDGREASDEQLCEAFAAVERARGATPLTYFEFGTLAAAWLFARASLDAWVLEVGLGGRLDAVNAIDADCAVLTSVGIDHVEYLGATRESIGREKAGIFRRGRPAVIADASPPASVLEHAANVGANVFLIGRDFGFDGENGQWRYWGHGGARASLAHPALRGAVQLRNAAAALCALGALRDRLPVGMQAVREGLARATLPGRFQTLPGRPQVILDVAHNPEAARTLAANLGAGGFAPETFAVFGMMRDKDISGVVREVAPRVSRWYLASLPGPRGCTSGELAAILRAAGVTNEASEYASPVEAFGAARERAQQDDKIIVFGSFVTVGNVMAYLKAERGGAGTRG